MSRRQKTLVVVWGFLWLGLGFLTMVGFLAESVLLDYGLWFAFGLMVLLFAGLAGGGLIAFHGLRSLGKSEASPWRLPPTWMLGGGFVLALLAGLGLDQAGVFLGFLLPVCVALAGALGPLAVISWLTGGRPGAITDRRGWVSFGLGTNASALMAYILNTLVPGAILFLVWDLADTMLPLAEDLFDALQLGPLTEELVSPWFLVAFVEIAVIAPLVEEMVKPLPLLPLLKRLDSRRDAFLAGALIGAGFAAVENLLYAAMFGSAWGGVVALRLLGSALHPFGAGLMAVAWWGVRHKEPGSGLRWVRNYALAVGVHALWNGTCLVAAAMTEAWYQGWEVELLGTSSAAVLLALLALQGIGLLVALRLMARRLEPAAEEAEPAPAQPTERSIAVWGLICLVVLVPLGVGVLRTMM